MKPTILTKYKTKWRTKMKSKSQAWNGPRKFLLVFLEYFANIIYSKLKSKSNFANINNRNLSQEPNVSYSQNYATNANLDTPSPVLGPQSRNISRSKYLPKQNAISNGIPNENGSYVNQAYVNQQSFNERPQTNGYYPAQQNKQMNGHTINDSVMNGYIFPENANVNWI